MNQLKFRFWRCRSHDVGNEAASLFERHFDGRWLIPHAHVNVD